MVTGHYFVHVDFTPGVISVQYYNILTVNTILTHSTKSRDVKALAIKLTKFSKMYDHGTIQILSIAAYEKIIHESRKSVKI